ncbi:MAG: PEP-CTERM sorting domain-containing protein [Desulfuromonadales bacterium]
MRKQIMALLVGATLMMGAGSAWAVPYTWTDTVSFNPAELIGWFESTSYTHDLTDNTPVAFTPGQDLITNYSLKVALHDDGGRKDYGEIAFIDQPGVLKDGFYNFDYTNNTFGWSLAGLIALNSYGTLEVTVKSTYGDFYLDSSVLTANGCDNTPVPEPGTMMLLGAGMLGLAIFGKRRMNKEA